MAPTEILARQHFESLRALAAPIGVNIRCLTGSTTAKERREIDSALADGSLHILVGTHAVIEDRVAFRNLGLVVIDEQHRFGVMQRARLWGKAATPPHILVMTATPIPRTLAMTVYGDLDVSVIDQLPPGRKPVTTLLRYENQRMDVLRMAGREIAAGRQVYIVYPLIDDNPKLALQSLAEGRDFVKEAFPSCRVAWVHGRMTPAEKEHQMHLFITRQAQILVATTVIEVGVNVPNASVMIIENAERFGLSQLHQLRGRVGRGADQSYCILMSRQNIGGVTRKRLELMTSTTDGFVIAEEDLKLRGPGDLEGTQQSGLPINLSIASLAADGQLVSVTRDEAIALLTADPRLSMPENAVVAQTLARLFQRPADLSRIS
ncbi:MAG: ATP-dependent DNA helicase RecG, partial [Muribaculaceae bacterium]|nr:ATP-dependent DNA helicase RecG [Muribaculaceae bacterium]